MSPAALRSLLVLLVVSLIAGCTSDRSAFYPPETADMGPESALDVDDFEDLEDSWVIVICVRKRMRVRAAYRPCDDAEPGFAWYFIPWKGKVPATGRKAKGGTFKDSGYMASPARRSGGVGSEAELSDGVRFEVCVKAKTRIRVSDGRCDDEDKGFTWYHIPYDDHIPAVGRKAVGGSFYRAGVENYRARAKGGTGDEARLNPDPPDDAPTTRPPRCTRTVNGKCDDATGSCTYTVNGRCRDNGGLPGRVPGGP